MNDPQSSINILAFGAHPDDVELGCGGTLAKLAALGKRTAIVDLTEGEMGTRGSVAERYQEAADAAKVLNVEHRQNLKISDAGIRDTDENRLKLIGVLRTLRPRMVFAPYPDDRHPDHIHAGNLVRESCFYSGVGKVGPRLGEPFRPEMILYYMVSTDFPALIVSDISEHFDTKVASIKAYRSQFYNPEYEGEETFISSQGYFDSITSRASYFGFKAGVRYAEPFWFRGPLLTRNVFNLLDS
ncbi:MAG: bacillithiol biosynthesis deacetylase BshB1 [Calditrichia bacterium]